MAFKIVKENCVYWVILRRAFINWWARSCDLTHLDYCLRCYVKLLVYANKAIILDESEPNIRVSSKNVALKQELEARVAYLVPKKLFTLGESRGYHYWRINT